MMTFGIDDLTKEGRKFRRWAEETVTKSDIKSVVDTTDKLGAFLDNCPDDLSTSIRDAMSGTGELSQEVLELKVLEKISTMLDNANCLADFFESHTVIRNIAAFSIVASSAASLIFPMLTLASEYSKNKENKRFHDAIEKYLTSINVELMQQTRMQSGMFLLQYNLSIDRVGSNTEDKQRLDSLANEARENIDYIPKVDRSLCQDYAKNLVDCLYTDPLITPLDAVCQNLTPDFIKASTMSDIPKTGAREFPSTDATQLSYAVVTKLFGKEQINKLMQSLYELYLERGGNELIGEILLHKCDERNYKLYLECVNSKDRIVTKLTQEAHQKGQEIYGADGPQLSDRVCRIIANRAYVEYCRHAGEKLRSVGVLASSCVGAFEAVKLQERLMQDPADGLNEAWQSISLEKTWQDPSREITKMFSLFNPLSNAMAADNVQRGNSIERKAGMLHKFV